MRHAWHEVAELQLLGPDLFVLDRIAARRFFPLRLLKRVVLCRIRSGNHIRWDEEGNPMRKRTPEADKISEPFLLAVQVCAVLGRERLAQLLLTEADLKWIKGGTIPILHVLLVG